jgi:hypothetical protein
LIDIKQIEGGLELLVCEQLVQLEVCRQELGVVDSSVPVHVYLSQDLLNLNGGALHRAIELSVALDEFLSAKDPIPIAIEALEDLCKLGLLLLV